MNKPGVYEDELGITLDYSINKLAGGMKGGKYKACICGGISMGVLGPNQLDIKLDFDDVRFRGGCLGLGTAGMIVMNEHTDMVAALRNCVRFYATSPAANARRAAKGGVDAKILDRIVDGGGRAQDLEMLMELEIRSVSRKPRARPDRRPRAAQLLRACNLDPYSAHNPAFRQR